MRVKVLVYFLLFLTLLMAAESLPQSEIPAIAPPAFVLTIQNQRLSLEAEHASVQAILEEIGRRMNIEVVGQLPAQEQITLTFAQLSLEEALGRLGRYTNYVYLTRAVNAPERINKIMIFPKRETTVPASQPGQVGVKTEERKPTSHPEPLHFEFDPSH